MAVMPILFPIEPDEYWKQMRILLKEVVEEVVADQLKKQIPLSESVSNVPQMILLKIEDVCRIFKISRPTVYQWIEDGKIVSFKIRGRRYFRAVDIEEMVK